MARPLERLLFCAAGLALATPFARAQVLYETKGEMAGAVAVGDTNLDGFADYVGVHCAPTNPTTCTFVLCDGTNGETLLTWPISAPGFTPDSYTAAGDLDGDGHGDVLTGEIWAEHAQVLSGRDGALLLELKAPNGVSQQFGMQVAAPGDMNGDGVPDYAVSGPEEITATVSNVGSVYLFSGSDGSVIYKKVGNESSDRYGQSMAVVHDVNGDGLKDLAVSEHKPTTRVHLLSGKTGKVLTTLDPGGWTQFAVPGIASLADIDGNGAAEVALASVGEIVFFDAASGQVTLRLQSDADRLTSAGDRDGDGSEDLAAWGGMASSLEVFSWPSGARIEHYWTNGPNMSATRLSDMTADGRPELLIATQFDRTVRVFSDQAWPSETGTLHGLGDGTGADCPCGNTAPNAGAGCANVTGKGAYLRALGAPLMQGNFHLSMHAGELPVGKPYALFAGTQPLNGGLGVPFGGGLRVAGGSVKRLKGGNSNLPGYLYWGNASYPSIMGWPGGWGPGDTLYFQIWYRDWPSNPCQTTNFTNAVELTFHN